MTKKEKQEKLSRVVEALKSVYPEAKCSLEYENDPWKLLIMGRLSAQCTDERVNIVCKELFEKFPCADDLANASIEEIEKIIKPCGLFRVKSKNIKDASIRLVRDYGGKLPDTMDELLKFEGVGRKVANLLLGDLFNKPAIVADTHCMRINGRLGIYKNGMKDPLKTEKILSELIEPQEQSDYCHRMVLFGRDFCRAQGPRCEICPIKHICKDE